MVPQNLFMLALFSDFYYKAYVQKSKKEITVNNNNNEDANANDVIECEKDLNNNIIKENIPIKGDARNRLNKIRLNGNANGNVISH